MSYHCVSDPSVLLAETQLQPVTYGAAIPGDLLNRTIVMAEPYLGKPTYTHRNNIQT